MKRLTLVGIALSLLAGLALWQQHNIQAAGVSHPTNDASVPCAAGRYDNGSGCVDATLVSIELTPINQVVTVGHSLQFTATGIFSDGSAQDLTTSVSWSSSNRTVAEISNGHGPRGLATGSSPGATDIRAVLDSVSGTTTLSVNNNPALVGFFPGSLIIPMDTDAQNNGMLRAYGLVYALLRSGVPVRWTINPAKASNGNDFTIGADVALEDFETGAVVPVPSAYRGGPFVIDSANAAAAMPIIQAWQADPSDSTVVHRVTAGVFTAEVARTLIAAPRIAVLKDSNEIIAFINLNAAGIPDSQGSLWSSSSPDLLTEADVEGPTTAIHTDGILFHQSSGLPRYAYLAAMHYITTSHTPEVVQEVRSWLGQGPLTHAFMQCEAAHVVENSAGGFFLTNYGIVDDGDAATLTTNRVPGNPLTQIDGPFQVDSGAMDSLRGNTGILPTYKTGVSTLINETSASLSQRIVLLTGRMDGAAQNGKVTYLVGHDYSIDLPITTNPRTNGVRLMLNTLFAADSAVDAPTDTLTLTTSAPTFINGATPNNTLIPYTISYTATGMRPAENLRLTETLPPGTTYLPLSASLAPTSIAGNVLVWNLPTLAPGATGTVTFKVTLSGDGSYTDSGARMNFSFLNVGAAVANPVTTVRDTIAPVITITSGPNGVTNDVRPDFGFSVAGDAITIKCGFDNQSLVPCAAPTFMSPTPLSGGSHTFQVQAADAAGNNVTASQTFAIDLDPPQASIPGPVINSIYYNVRRPTFVFSASDSGGGPVTTNCSVAGSPFALCTSPWQVPAFAPLNGLADGAYVFQVQPRDSAGNVGPIASYAFTIDTIAPVVSIPVPPNVTVTNDSTPTFVFSVISSGGSPTTTKCRIDAGALTTCAAPYTAMSLSDGMHIFQVQASDAAGNAVVDSLTFTVDTSAPVVTIAGPPANPAVTNDNTPSFAFSVSTGGTPVVMTQCQIDSGPFTPCTSPFTVASALSDGVHVFQVRAIDAAGNVGDSARFNFRIDTEPSFIVDFREITYFKNNNVIMSSDAAIRAANNLTGSFNPAVWPYDPQGGANKTKSRGTLFRVYGFKANQVGTLIRDADTASTYVVTADSQISGVYYIQLNGPARVIISPSQVQTNFIVDNEQTKAWTLASSDLTDAQRNVSGIMLNHNVARIAIPDRVRNELAVLGMPLLKPNGQEAQNGLVDYIGFQLWGHGNDDYREFVNLEVRFIYDDSVNRLQHYLYGFHTSKNGDLESFKGCSYLDRTPGNDGVRFNDVWAGTNVTNPQWGPACGAREPSQNQKIRENYAVPFNGMQILTTVNSGDDSLRIFFGPIRAAQ